MPKRPVQHAAFYDPLYKIQFHVFRGPEALLVAQCKRDGQPIGPHDGAARCVNYVAPGRGQMVVCLWFSPAYPFTTPFGASCVAHECVHATNSVFERIGARATLAWHDDEPYAYYLEWLVREIHRRMR